MNFKKFGSRVAAVAATMAIVASMSAVSVSAADYGQNTTPVTPTPSPEDIYVNPVDPNASNNQDMEEGSGGVSGSEAPKTDDTKTEEEKTEEETIEETVAVEESEGTVLDADAVASAIEDALLNGEAAVVEMSADESGSVTITSDSLGALVEAGVPVTISVSGGTGTLAYAVTIDPAKLANINGNIDIGMTVKSNKGNVNGCPVPKSAVIISPAADGEIGATLEVKLDSAALKNIKNLKAAKLFRVNKNGVVEEVENGLIVDAKTGEVTALIDDGSYEYVVSDKNIVAAKEKADSKKETTKAKGAVPGTGKGVAALGLIDASAISVAAILAKKKKKK